MRGLFREGAPACLITEDEAANIMPTLYKTYVAISTASSSNLPHPPAKTQSQENLFSRTNIFLYFFTKQDFWKKRDHCGEVTACLVSSVDAYW